MNDDERDGVLWYLSIALPLLFFKGGKAYLMPIPNNVFVSKSNDMEIAGFDTSTALGTDLTSAIGPEIEEKSSDLVK